MLIVYTIDDEDDSIDDVDDDAVAHCANQHMLLVLGLVMMLSSQNQRFASQLLRHNIENLQTTNMQTCVWG